MLHWKPLSNEHMEEFKEWVPFVKAMLESKGLEQKSASLPPDTSNLPDDVQKTVTDAQPFYEELYKLRLTI